MWIKTISYLSNPVTIVPTAGKDLTVRMWDVTKGSEVLLIEDGFSGERVSIKKLLLCCNDQYIVVVTQASGFRNSIFQLLVYSARFVNTLLRDVFTQCCTWRRGTRVTSRLYTCGTWRLYTMLCVTSWHTCYVTSLWIRHVTSVHMFYVTYWQRDTQWLDIMALFQSACTAYSMIKYSRPSLTHKARVYTSEVYDTVKRLLRKCYWIYWIVSNLIEQRLCHCTLFC